MKKILEIALGVVTSVGGFLEIGSITTAAQAGADFSLQLIWTIVLGGLCIIFLVEQAGRFTAVSGRTIPDAIRERFGSNYFVLLYVVLGLVSLLVRIFNGQTPDNILHADLYFMNKIGMERFIGTQRSNGFAAMIKQMKLYALAFKTKMEVKS